MCLAQRHKHTRQGERAMLCTTLVTLWTCFCGAMLVMVGSIVVWKYLGYTRQKDSNMLDCILAVVIGVVMTAAGIGLIA